MTQPSFGTVAPTSRRAVAYIIDAAIAAGIGVVLAVLLVVFAVMAGPDGMLGVIAIGAPIIWLVLLGWFVFYTFMQAGNGSIGMRAQRLRLVREDDGAPLGFGKALLRNIIFGLAAGIVVGYFTPLFDGSGRFQGWHDKVARSLMLDAGAPASGTPRLAPDELPASYDAVPPRPAPPVPTSMPGFASASPGFVPPPAAAEDTVASPAQPEQQSPAPSAAPPAAGTFSRLEPSSDDDESVERTVLSPPIRRDLPDDPLISFVPGVTQEPVQRTEMPVAVPAPTPDAASDPAPQVEDDDEDDDIESTRISVPGHRLVFTWDDGQRATVSGRTVFGRNPEERGGATNVPVRDETRSLSKTHFEAGADAHGGWIMDRQSTNGTVIVRDGVRIACPPGQRVPVRLGDALEIGDRIVTIGGYV